MRWFPPRTLEPVGLRWYSEGDYVATGDRWSAAGIGVRVVDGASACRLLACRHRHGRAVHLYLLRSEALLGHVAASDLRFLADLWLVGMVARR